MSVELSDTRRLGSRHCPPDASETRRRYPADEVSRSRWRVKTAGESARGTGTRPKPRGNATNTRKCQARPRLPPQPSGTHEKQASCAGPRPEGVYVYAENIHRGRRPSRRRRSLEWCRVDAQIAVFSRGEHGCGNRGRTLERHPRRCKPRACSYGSPDRCRTFGQHRQRCKPRACSHSGEKS